MSSTIKKIYKQKYRVEWESESCFAGWLKKAPDNSENKGAYCNACSCYLVAQKKNLVDHGNSEKHKAALRRDKEVVTLPKIDTFAKPMLSLKRKTAELQLAFFTAKHTSLKTIDHLAILVKGLDSESAVLKEIQMHRTKCAALIKNNLSPCILQELLEDIGDSFFSLIVDESTAVDSKKLLCLVIRYFSKTKQTIITTFYSLIEMESGTADAISNAILMQLKKNNLNTNKLLGIGVDGASVNVGQNHSLSTILRSVNSEIIIIKCICHSLHLAAEKACDVLPRNLDYMVKESHNWFSQSTKRQLEYNQIYKIINDSEPKKLVKLSSTRWLVRTKAISTIINQWDVLKLHFSLAETKEKCFAAMQLAAMYKEVENKLYLVFICATLKPVIQLNTNFQSDTANLIKLFSDLNDLFYSILQKIVVPARLATANITQLQVFDFKKYLMPVDCINFGFDFNTLSTAVSRETVNNIKIRCREFLINLAYELQQRIPDNINILEKISVFTQENASSQIKPDITEVITKFQYICGDVDETNRQWNLLHRVEIRQKEEVTEYWKEIYNIKNANGERKFENICKLVFTLLSLPISNAAVERVFSIINIVKDKLRNLMCVPMVEAILHVRCTALVNCTQFKPSAEMIKRFNSEEICKKINESDVEILDVFDF